MYVHVHRVRTSFFQNLFLTYPTPILGRSDGEFFAQAKNIAAASTTDILGLYICSANVLLLRTTAIRGGTEISVGVNRGNRYEARVKINRRRIFDTLRINFY